MIHILDDYYIDATDKCYILGKKSVRHVKQKDGTSVDTEVLVDCCYYNTLSTALQSLYERVLRGAIKSSSGDINALKQACRESEQRVRKAIETNYNLREEII